MNIVNDKLSQSKFFRLQKMTDDLSKYIKKAAKLGKQAHEVEQSIFSRVLEIGHQAFGCFLKAQGDGNIGEKVTLPDGKEVKRLMIKSKRYYQSVFGKFEIERCCYGTRDGQKIEFIPLDERLDLPKSDYGYLLQEWSQYMAVEMPYEKTQELLEKIFSINMPVDSIERINRAQASYVEGFRETKKIDMEQEAELLVISADGKGVPIRHKRDQRRIEEHKHKRGPKPDRKRMAIVGTVYSVAPFERTPEEIVEALFLEAEKESKAPQRPPPRNKHVVANLTREVAGETKNALPTTFEWMSDQVAQRDSAGAKPHIALMDGQPSLWEELHRNFGEGTMIEILDLLHVTSRLWDAAHIFYPDNQSEQIVFMKDRLLRVLSGKVRLVISGLRQMATKQNISQKKYEALGNVCNYLEKNAPRMKYDEYLRNGYPIASGVIEGACRHFVKDRMERAGMRWLIDGAQAMLDMRSTYLNGDGDAFMKYRINTESATLYHNRTLTQKINWPLLA
jgi:hypothetical protein